MSARVHFLSPQNPRLKPSTTISFFSLQSIRNEAVIRRLSAHYPTPKQAGLKPDNGFVQLVTGLGWGAMCKMTGHEKCSKGVYPDITELAL